MLKEIKKSELTEQGDRDRQTQELKCHCFNQIINKRQMLKSHLSSICLHKDDSQVIYSHDRLITEEDSGHRWRNKQTWQLIAGFLRVIIGQLNQTKLFVLFNTNFYQF